ncbi:type II toxin-antitoxin system RatA family toxin [Planctobacterium marinum]|uniref:type II toxin-antitoxin system RatA family toxin n=1 Tax=Planctobacterium marinum TaxID=1631968 RepID=UPI001E4A87A5|nr:type II toxin-antitoxin system RatA family toxin [Planctobacterium marinum]MCC2607345.1 type II toxin-antitoxin system RatA family toxin [Planctobacterium marinum]
MPAVNRSALVPYSAAKMYDLVNDVTQYPQFLPGCEDARILEQEEQLMVASLLVSKAGVKQWFTTRNELTKDSAISMNLQDGPFKQLTGGWRFTELAENACKIELELEFEFSNSLAQLAFGKVFSTLANNMVKAFTERAKEIYRG